MRTHRLGWVVAVASLAAACSVSTPRGGEDMAASSPGAVGATTAAEGGATPVAGAADGQPDAGVAESAAPQAGSTDGVTSAVGGTSGGASGGPARAAPGAVPAPGSGSVGETVEARTASAPGVTVDTVTVSVVAGFSGPLSALVNKAYEALLTWQEDVNAGGGIHGRKVVLKPVDHKETADGGVAACKEALSNGSFIAVVPEGIEANVTAVSCLDAAGMPTVYFAAAADPKWKVAFADTLTSAQGGVLLGGYVRNNLKATGKKIGVMYVNQAAYKSTSDAFVPEAKRLGLNVARVEAVEPNQASFTAQLLRMREAGVQVLVISATVEALGIVRDAKSMGFTPQITGWGYLFDFVTQGARNLFDGVSGLRPYATVDGPEWGKYASRMAARGRPRENRAADLEGFVTYARALLYGEMLQRAGVNPTRQSFVAGAETIRGYDNGIIPPITFGPGDHIGSDAAFPAVCCNGDYTWKGQGPAKAKFA